ncbi:transposase domain-containing protein [Mesorhizobium sp. M0923]|uniref:transposase domain-containing protein n=1 Tax=Mesorhizobium sp. M0923 TaxID=2957028 RepID=UPI00333634E7
MLRFSQAGQAWRGCHRDAGGDPAPVNDVDPQAWLADVLARIADTSITQLESLELDDRSR